MELEVFRFTLEEELTMLARLIVAGVAAGVVGFERGVVARKATGIRTMSLVGMGAAVFTMAGAFGFADDDGVLDPSRVAAQVATGVGFIGAGAIIRTGASIRGITTAASIWLAAALGLAAGTGLYVLAVAGALIAALALWALPRAGAEMGIEPHEEPEER